VEVKRVNETNIHDLVKADAIIFGSPTYFGEMSGRMKAFIDESEKVHGKLKGKIGAAFTSSGGTASGAETTLLSIVHAMLIHGMIVQGRFDDKHYGATAVEAPDNEDVQSCKDLGRRVTELATRLST